MVRYGFATKGDPIPGINEGDDLTDKYLWVRQELSTNNATHSPELESLELEIKGEAVIAGKGEDAYQLSYYDGQLRGYINNQRVSSALTLDQYQHVAITYNGSHQRIYVNGLLTGTLALTGDINTNASNLVMGLNLEGELDEFRLSPVARSQAWLQAEYHSGTGDLVQIGGEAQNVNAVYTASGTFGGVGAGPLRVGFGATGTSSRTASGASYWGIMELSGNLWKMTIAAGSVAGREFTGLHGDGVLTEAGFFNTANWNAGTLGLRGAGFTTALDRLRVSDRNNITTLDAAGRHNNRGGRGVRTAP
ncbi:MAG: LamG domain-containing protein [Marinilabiliales bacterium]|nr:MAG: LamG domain-containing protein [Marinilabiliales bacterium]